MSTARPGSSPVRPGADRWWLVLVLLAGFGTLCLAVTSRWGPLVRLDHAVAGEAFGFTASRPWLVHAALVVQGLFSTWPMAAYAVVAALLLARRGDLRSAPLPLAAVVVTALVTTAVKLAIARPRPHWREPLATLTSPSFPSGHSSSITAAATVAVLLLASAAATRSRRRLVVSTAVAITLVVGSDRILLGVHYLSDVVGGCLLGGLVALTCWLVLTYVSGSRRVSEHVFPQQG